MIDPIQIKVNVLNAAEHFPDTARPEPYDDRTLDAVLTVIDEYTRTKTWASDIRQLKILKARVEKLRGDRG